MCSMIGVLVAHPLWAPPYVFELWLLLSCLFLLRFTPPFLAFTSELEFCGPFGRTFQGVVPNSVVFPPVLAACCSPSFFVLTAALDKFFFFFFGVSPVMFLCCCLPPLTPFLLTSSVRMAGFFCRFRFSLRSPGFRFCGPLCCVFFTRGSCPPFFRLRFVLLSFFIEGLWSHFPLFFYSLTIRGLLHAFLLLILSKRVLFFFWNAATCSTVSPASFFRICFDNERSLLQTFLVPFHFSGSLPPPENLFSPPHLGFFSLTMRYLAPPFLQSFGRAVTLPFWVSFF